MPKRTEAKRQRLDVYERKRDFAKTPEPKARVAKTRGPLRFVVQKHRATALHYDFRLEAGGALRSWAVPRGPSLDPKQKRLAMEVEDHPLEYASFEGVIPEGEYGGGTVMIWDEGVWMPMAEVDPVAALEKGELRFVLDGKKLKGSWTLVHTDGRRWLLIKRRDEHAGTDEITVTQPRSARTKRLLAEIARDEGGDVVKAATGDGPLRAAQAVHPRREGGR
ncbi:MAG TPA: DNA polymerase ligase N-terminal domain-containing protein [Candidatus Limnocylindria bacterium]|jgi:bifunctional non-homologous end joining protein LigD